MQRPPSVDLGSPAEFEFARIHQAQPARDECRPFYSHDRTNGYLHNNSSRVWHRGVGIGGSSRLRIGLVSGASCRRDRRARRSAVATAASVRPRAAEGSNEYCPMLVGADGRRWDGWRGRHSQELRSAIPARSGRRWRRRAHWGCTHSLARY
jgi:hypothetical protein